MTVLNRSGTDKRGSVTVATSLCLVFVLLFDIVVYDAAGIISAKYFYGRRTELAAESILASFDSLLFEKYGLLGLNISNYTEYETDFIKYIAEPVWGGHISSGRLKRTGQEISLTGPLADPESLTDAIVAQMKYKSVANGAEALLGYFGLIGDGENSCGVSGIVAKGEAVLSRAEEKVRELKRKVEGVYSGDTMCVNGFSYSYSLFIMSAGRVLKTTGSVRIEDAPSVVREALEEYKGQLGVYASLNAESIGIIRELREMASEITNYASKAEKSLESVGDSGLRSELRKRISALRAGAFRISNDTLFEGLSSNVENFGEKTALVSENINMIDTAAAALGGGEISDLWENVDIGGFCSNLEKALDVSDIKCDFSVSVKYLNVDENLACFDSRNQTQDYNIFRTDGYEIDNSVYNTLPSVKARAQKGDGASSFSFDSLSDLDNILSSVSFGSAVADAAMHAAERLMTCDYISTYFKDYLSYSPDVQDNGFCCEKEYIAGGYNNSTDNMKSVAWKLFLLRFCFNFVHCITSESKREFAESVGNAVAAAVSGGIGGEIYAYLIMCAWSSAEAYLDVNALESGEKVELIKTESNWKTSIEGLTGSAAAQNDPDTGSETNAGLGYSQYLMILIMLMPTETLLLRTADLIEINMTEITSRRYMLTGVFTGVDAKVTYLPDIIVNDFCKITGGAINIEISKRKTY